MFGDGWGERKAFKASKEKKRRERSRVLRKCRV